MYIYIYKLAVNKFGKTTPCLKTPRICSAIKPRPSAVTLQLYIIYKNGGSGSDRLPRLTCFLGRASSGLYSSEEFRDSRIRIRFVVFKETEFFFIGRASSGIDSADFA
ncbi:hypothetical protein AVEN_171691-1 [Araneus ventricosus]|uniref:Uncharacterized protein n=1 Tax=Araneus ventricosus TaxID=182803 RepID=A0A4Y2SYY5_ARAVE|nr:hypothetical protein AVEN_171691-1 [Araneus ventricosus]